MKTFVLCVAGMLSVVAGATDAQVDRYGRALEDQGVPVRLQPVETDAEAGEREAVETMGASQSFSLAPFRSTIVGSNADAVEIGDVSGDGRADVVLSTTFYFDAVNDYSVFLYRQSPTGVLEAPLRYSYQMNQTGNRNGLAIVDLDGQFGLDVVLGGGSGLSTFRSTSSGTLAPGPASLRQEVSALAALDLTGDGFADIATVSWSSGGQVYRSRGDGTFDGTPWAASVAGWNAMASGDLDGDGDVDVAVTSGQGLVPNVRLYRNSGDGTLVEFFAGDGSCVRGSWFPRGVGIGDVNGDGLADVVVSAGGNRPSSCIRVFTGTGDGGFVAQPVIASYDIPETLRVVDLDMDGLDDVVVLHGGWNRLGVYFQRADGTLAPEQLVPIPYASHYGVHGLAIGDFTGDGCNDVAIADYNNGLVTLQGQRCAPVFASGFEP